MNTHLIKAGKIKEEKLTSRGRDLRSSFTKRRTTSPKRGFQGGSRGPNNDRYSCPRENDSRYPPRTPEGEGFLGEGWRKGKITLQIVVRGLQKKKTWASEHKGDPTFRTEAWGVFQKESVRMPYGGTTSKLHTLFGEISKGGRVKGKSGGHAKGAPSLLWRQRKKRM